MTAPARVLTSQEPWVEYQLDDGTLLRFRWTACNFRRTGKTTEQGDPEYSFTQQVQCETHAPKPVARLFALPANPIAPAFDPNQTLSAQLLDASTYLADFRRTGNQDTAPCEYLAPEEDCG